MANENNDEGIVADVEETNDEGQESSEAKADKTEKPKRTPQEELEYFEGRASWLRKKLGIETKNDDSAVETKSAPKGTPSEDLDYGEKAYLRSALSLKGSDELQLARDWKKKYGSTVEEMESDEVFLNRLSSLRESRETSAAIPKSKNRSGQQAVTDADIAFAKFKESGELPADYKTRVEVMKKAIEQEKSKNMFSGPSVIGPTGQMM